MAVLQSGQEIYIDETERKPNLYAANVLAGIVGVMAIVWIMNETGVFEVNKLLMRTCLVASLLMFLIIQLIVRRAALLTHPATKYIIMGIVLFLVMILNTLLNIHAVLAYVLPLLLATQYRSHKISLVALFGSCICCGIAPLLSYLFSTWSLIFLTGYVQTFCHVTVSTTPGNSISTAEAVQQITLYWSLPQMLTIGAFGLILYSATKSGIDSVTNQIKVSDLSHDLKQQLESITSMQEQMLFSMSDIIESRDLETGGHVRRTSEVVRLLTDAIRQDPQNDISDTFYNNIIKSAPMHDLGKISIPDAILRKPGALTESEYDIVKQHPVKSAEIISHALTGIEDTKLLTVAQNIAMYHHERYDGTGYPNKLKGTEIPLEARIMAIADVYDALVNKRCYKEPIPFDEAFSSIEASMGTQFDPDLEPYFVSCKQDIEKFYKL